mmetsp:Transcript_54560/g.119627  ORF Transcript_54560/g.119627 Transcript_54560/m.119627 type:complete len:289 (-) Transcript_54560:17-883(-)
MELREEARERISSSGVSRPGTSISFPPRPMTLRREESLRFEVVRLGCSGGGGGSSGAMDGLSVRRLIMCSGTSFGWGTCPLAISKSSGMVYPALAINSFRSSPSFHGVSSVPRFAIMNPTSRTMGMRLRTWVSSTLNNRGFATMTVVNDWTSRFTLHSTISFRYTVCIWADNSARTTRTAVPTMGLFFGAGFSPLSPLAAGFSGSAFSSSSSFSFSSACLNTPRRTSSLALRMARTALHLRCRTTTLWRKFLAISTGPRSTVSCRHRRKKVISSPAAVCRSASWATRT